MVAKLIQLYGILDPNEFLNAGKKASFMKGTENNGEQKEMKSPPEYPSLCQINTRVWLTELSSNAGPAGHTR